jgi:hypothetical protein
MNRRTLVGDVVIKVEGAMGNPVVGGFRVDVLGSMLGMVDVEGRGNN